PAPADCERCWHDGQLLEQDGMIFTAGSPPIFAIPTASRRGYNGRIDVITGVGLAGEQQTPTIVAVEISRHRETPGIGDRIEADKTPWLTRFRNRTSTAGLDALSGATISALAVADAVDKALEFARANRDQLTAQAEP